MYMPIFSRLFLLAIIIILSNGLISCSSSGDNTNTYSSSRDGVPHTRVDVNNIPDAIPQKTTPSKYGNPKSYVVYGKRYHVLKSSKGYKERGIASWYGSKFQGKRTSSGEPYDAHAMTAAHKTLPLPTYVKVTNLRNNRQVILKVNDRGPFHENRIIDLSHTAAVKLGIKATGTGLVEVEAIDVNQATKTIPKVTQKISSAVSTSNGQGKAVKLYLQLGAFVSVQNAYHLKNQANQSLGNNSVFVSSLMKNGYKFYRVRIGPLENAEQADSIAQQLENQGFHKQHIIIE